jgi:hypothetical protein
MHYTYRFEYTNKYERTSTKRGSVRYKQSSTKRVRVVKLTADVTSDQDMQRICILSDQLATPVMYDFSASPQTASIEFVSLDVLTV